jgi:hypothetical protein
MKIAASQSYQKHVKNNSFYLTESGVDKAEEDANLE